MDSVGPNYSTVKEEAHSDVSMSNLKPTPSVSTVVESRLTRDKSSHQPTEVHQPYMPSRYQAPRVRLRKGGSCRERSPRKIRLPRIIQRQSLNAHGRSYVRVRSYSPTQSQIIDLMNKKLGL